MNWMLTFNFKKVVTFEMRFGLSYRKSGSLSHGSAPMTIANAVKLFKYFNHYYFRERRDLT